MRKLFVLVGMAMVAALAMSSSAAASTTCSGTQTGQAFSGDLVVPANGSCTIVNSTVGDDVKVGENAYEVDATLDIDQINRTVGLNLPEDAGYETLGGFVSVMLGRIPSKGTTFEHNAVRYTILDAEPQRVKRLKLELLPQVAEAAGKPS